MVKIRVAGTLSDSIVDGPGLRYVVFTQGCPLACKGCHNPATWDTNGGKELDVEQICADMFANPMLTGLTLSGGEPSLQAGACALLAKAAKSRGMSVWSYSGYRIERLLERSRTQPDIRAWLNALDVLVDGPFILAKRTLSLPWRGSTNQRLIDVPATLLAGVAVECAKTNIESYSQN